MARKASGKKKKSGAAREEDARPPEARDPVSLAADVYREVGGFRRFVEWASDEKNIGVFYKDIFLKMLARGVEASNEREEAIVVRIENRAKE
jgi:hypothetical protein